MLIESEGVIKTWKKLKTVLKDEFADKVNSAQLHEMLRKRKLKKEESLQEYYLTMKEIASRGKLEPEALIQYIIDGITDDTQNKLVLYGTRRLADFKDKLKIYESMRKRSLEKGKMREKNEAAKKQEECKKPTVKKTKQPTDPEARCYNCGAKGHQSKDCKKKVG